MEQCDNPESLVNSEFPKVLLFWATIKFDVVSSDSDLALQSHKDSVLFCQYQSGFCLSNVKRERYGTKS